MPFFLKVCNAIKWTALLMNVRSRIPNRIWYNIYKCIRMWLFKKWKSMIISFCHIMSNEIIVISIFIKIKGKLLREYSFYSCRPASIIFSFEINWFFDKILSENKWLDKISYIIIICTESFTLFIFITFNNFDCKWILIS